jgi:2-phosphosulfolactate phosphatase
MRKAVAIDCLPESVCRYRVGWAIVVVDVIRATTTAITAKATGRRCFPVPTIEAALSLAQKYKNPVLAGESGGTIPTGFEMDNSPAQLIHRADTHRP